MARVYSQHTHHARNTHDAHHGDDSQRSERRRATATTSARPQAMLEQERAATTARVQLHAQPQHLDLKALRLAVHGWWLGNPLVYKPGVADLRAVARELAGAGAAGGTLVLSDTPDGSDGPASNGTKTLSDAEALPHDAVHAVLILRPTMPPMRMLLGTATAQAVAEVTQAVLGRPCAVRWRWQVVLRDGGRIALCLGRVSAEQDEDVALVDMRFALDRLWQAAQDDAGQVSPTLFARSDWREVFLARVLHTLDRRLRELHVT